MCRKNTTEEAEAAKQREWNAANRDQIRAAARERHQRIKPEANAARRALYIKRDEARLARERRAADPAAYCAAQRAYRAENRAKVAVWDSTKCAKRRGAEGRHTAVDVQDHYNSQAGCCYWCGVAVGSTYHVDQVIPLARGGTNWPSNIVVACPSCNPHKHAKLPEEWVQWLLEHQGISHRHSNR